MALIHRACAEICAHVAQRLLITDPTTDRPFASDDSTISPPHLDEETHRIQIMDSELAQRADLPSMRVEALHVELLVE